MEVVDKSNIFGFTDLNKKIATWAAKAELKTARRNSETSSIYLTRIIFMVKIILKMSNSKLFSASASLKVF